MVAFVETADLPVETKRSDASAIRALAPRDMAGVAQLFNRTFRKTSDETASREAVLRQIFCEHPWQDAGLHSLVYERPDGSVRGFIGVLPLRVTFNGASVRAALAGMLMVEDPASAPLAGAGLMRAFLKGPQDLSLTESANGISQRMWKAAGGGALTAYSMEWVRILRPAGFGIDLLRRRAPKVGLLGPVAGGIDGLIARRARNPFRLTGGPNRSADVGGEEIMSVILELADAYAVRPQWDRASLGWMLDQAAAKEGYGALHCRVVYGARGKVVGCYLYHERAKGTAFVLQMLARPGGSEAVVDDLLAHASDRGAVAVSGRVQPEFADALLGRRSFFLRVNATLVDTKNRALLAALHAGAGLVTGLAGESWTQLVAGVF